MFLLLLAVVSGGQLVFHFELIRTETKRKELQRRGEVSKSKVGRCLMATWRNLPVNPGCRLACKSEWTQQGSEKLTALRSLIGLFPHAHNLWPLQEKGQVPPRLSVNEPLNTFQFCWCVASFLCVSECYSLCLKTCTVLLPEQALSKQSLTRLDIGKGIVRKNSKISMKLVPLISKCNSVIVGFKGHRTTNTEQDLILMAFSCHI